MPIYAGSTPIVGAYAGSTALKAVYAGSNLVWEPEEPGGGGFNPLTQVSAYNAYWADDPNWTKPADGGTVTSWRDGGAGGVNLSASGGPTWHAAKAGFNGHAAITFDGTDDYLFGDVTDRFQPFKLVVVAKMESAVSSCNFIAAGNNNARGLGVSAGNLFFSGMSGGADLTNGTRDTATHVHRVLLNGTNGTYSIDGATPVVGGSGTNGFVYLGVGAGLGGTPGTAGRFCNCSVAFVGLYSGGTEDEALDELVADLMDYYGIT